jgi:hypothetical protein
MIVLVNAKELFNLHHSSVHNIIKWIFRILKNKFSIPMITLHYSMDIQAQFAPTLTAIHNFIRLYNSDEIFNLVDEAEDIQPRAQIPQMGDLALEPPRGCEEGIDR